MKKFDDYHEKYGRLKYKVFGVPDLDLPESINELKQYGNSAKLLFKLKSVDRTTILQYKRFSDVKL